MRRADLSTLDALVLAEIESLGHGRQARAVTGRPAPESASARKRPGGASDQMRTFAKWPGQAARGPCAEATAPNRSGEEAEGLFDEPFELADPGDDPSRDGPTAADLLSPEELAFVARAAGFLSGRPNADLILDRIWSQALGSQPDGFYDPDCSEVWPHANPEPRAAADGSDKGPEAPGATDADDRPRSRAASESAAAPSDIRPRPVAAATAIASPGARGQSGRHPSPSPAPSPAPMPGAIDPSE